MIELFGCSGDPGIDPGIVSLIEQLNKSGYRTLSSCSGLKVDHPSRPWMTGLLIFDLKHESSVRRAAKKLRLKRVWVGKTWGIPSIEIAFPEGLTDDETRKLWADLRVALLGGEYMGASVGRLDANPQRHAVLVNDEVLDFLRINALPNEAYDDTIRRLASLPPLARRTAQGLSTPRGPLVLTRARPYRNVWLREETYSFLAEQKQPQESWGDTLRRLIGMEAVPRAGVVSIPRRTAMHYVLVSPGVIDELVSYNPASVDAALRDFLKIRQSDTPWEFTWHKSWTEASTSGRTDAYAISLEVFKELDRLAGKGESIDDMLRRHLGLIKEGRPPPTPRRLIPATPRGRREDALESFKRTGRELSLAQVEESYFAKQISIEQRRVLRDYLQR